MKRFLAIILIVLLTISVSASCRPKAETASEAKKAGGEKISVVTTIFPAYDFVRQVAGDKADIKMLLAPGAESHSFEPTPKDIIAIRNCDVFIYTGGVNDEWVDRILDTADTENIKIIKLLDCVEALDEEVKEGMSDGHGHEHEAESAGDEHVWTSPLNAIAITNVIRDVLCSADSANAGIYQANAEKYTKRLTELDAAFRAVIKDADRRTVVFGDRFPILYFAKEYGLDYWAAFPGCSAETEPSAATVKFLIDKVRSEQIPVVFKIELSNGNIARSIAEATGAKVLVFNSCHNLTKEKFDGGATYLSLMEENLEALREALN
jgi:zinc transport system substrate-binding protein